MLEEAMTHGDSQDFNTDSGRKRSCGYQEAREPASESHYGKSNWKAGMVGVQEDSVELFPLKPCLNQGRLPVWHSQAPCSLVRTEMQEGSMPRPWSPTWGDSLICPQYSLTPLLTMNSNETSSQSKWPA